VASTQQFRCIKNWLRKMIFSTAITIFIG